MDIKYLDWEGLQLYDEKIKELIDDKVDQVNLSIDNNAKVAAAALNDLHKQMGDLDIDEISAGDVYSLF